MDYIGYITGSYQADVRAAFELSCERIGFDVLFIAGRALEPPPSHIAHYNSVYELVNPRLLDGVVLVSAGLATYSQLPGLERLCQRYAGLAICSLGVRIPGVASVTADNRLGFEELLEHVLLHHGCQNVAFIGGPAHNPDAAVRFETYKRALARCGRAFDPALVEHAHFTLGTGAQALKTLLARGVPIDAVVAANDGMALGAIEALREAGKRTPRDMLVTGFDDSAMGRFGDPPLTTVRQPLDAMVQVSLALLNGQFSGEPVAEHVDLPVEFVARASCGCRLSASWRPREPASTPAPSAPCTGSSKAGSWPFRRAAARVGVAAGILLENLNQALAEAPGDAFQSALEELVTQAPPDRSIELLDALCEDLQVIERSLVGQAERTAQLSRAREFLQSAQMRAVLQRSREFEAAYHEHRHVAERLSSVLDRGALRKVLETEIGCLDVRALNVLLYPEHGPRELLPFFFWSEDAGAPACEGVDVSELVPAGARSGGEARRWLVLPLVSENHDWGVIAMEPGSQQRDYERIPDLFSTALMNIALHQELVEQTMLHERSVQERLATAERLKALGVLAGGVAHDLNNALGPLLALPDVMQRELDAMPVEPQLTRELHTDLAAIRAATNRASRTIRDLVTLGRQGHARRSPLDLNRLVKSCVTGAESPFARSNVWLRIDLHPEPLMIEASEAHLTRAIINLVQNAMEACTGSGTIVVQTGQLLTESARSGYETILPGDHALLTISDSGAGIPSELLGRIFEPFFSSKPLSETSGTGLGLALVHGVVKEHGGFIDVKSTPGTGTTFTLYFPRTKAVPREVAERVAPERGSGRLLVIDDDPLQVRSARRVLSSLGYQLTALTSGRAACELFESARKSSEGARESPFDLVITDVLLGEELDGLQVCERIRELFPHQKLLIVSGHAATERAAAATARGIAWLIKPYTADELGRAVSEVLHAPPERPLAAQETRPLRVANGRAELRSTLDDPSTKRDTGDPFTR
jgi:DNA-binding LacI/PurR family transcriptional regulator/signal transduction histidine kinase/ActR/RegA family two-component response regulator